MTRDALWLDLAARSFREAAQALKNVGDEHPSPEINLIRELALCAGEYCAGTADDLDKQEALRPDSAVP